MVQAELSCSKRNVRVGGVAEVAQVNVVSFVSKRANNVSNLMLQLFHTAHSPPKPAVQPQRVLEDEKAWLYSGIEGGS